MNFTETNFTEMDSLELDPLLKLEDEDEPTYIGFIESSLLKMIPKFFKAMATLIISGLLLGVTFLLINLWKRGCRTHRKLEEEKATNGSAGSHLHSVVVTPPTDDNTSVNDGTSKSAIPSSSSLQPIKSKYMKVPKQQLRRASGPFGSEALSFAVEQYTMKNLDSKGQKSHSHMQGHLHHHYPHGHSHNHSQQNIRSGASSAGGGSVNEQQQNETTKSKWNCFKGTKE